MTTGQARHSRIGIEHIGITVPSIADATAFLARAFGAETMYDLVPAKSLQDPGGREAGLASQRHWPMSAVLGTPEGTRIDAIRMIAIGDGPVIEMFEFAADDQRDPVRPHDFGMQHMCVYVDDIEQAAADIEAAGGELFAGPTECPNLEAGDGNQWRYARTPWGMTIEIITYPSPMPYEALTPLRRPAQRAWAANNR
jgi:catechol 2,3-dioxygenase-like lactoylglutathione lyase family enzyme